MSSPIHPFSERAFYLTEFRRRTIGIAWPTDEAFEAAPLSAVADELVANQTGLILMSPSVEILDAFAGHPPVELGEPDFAPQLWRALRAHGRAGLRVAADGFEERVQRATLGLRLAKLVWIRERPPIVRRPDAEDGQRVSMVDLGRLAKLLEEPGAAEVAGLAADPESRSILASIRATIAGGVPGVNVCAAADLARELFTYAGAGTFFTRDRYAEVRPLGLDEFDAAGDLIARGEADGFLLPRPPASRDAILSHGVGVFIEGRYLAGIGAILPHPAENAAEIASLYALTRYAGEGAGSQIVRFALERARAGGLDYLFSCTTSDRVVQFFERHGFRPVSPDAVPRAKWKGYDPARRKRVRCLRLDVEATSRDPGPEVAEVGAGTERARRSAPGMARRLPRGGPGPQSRSGL